MTTVRDIVTDAASASTVLGQGETLTDTDASLIFRRFIRMLESWSNERLMIYDIYIDTLPLTAGVAAYSSTLLSQGRPVNVDSLYVRNSNIDYPIELISNQTYGDYTYKITTAVPGACWYDASFPNSTFNFYPVPYTAFTAYVSCLRNLNPASATLDTVLSFPPGYEKAFVDNLAVDLCPSFGVLVSQDLRLSAQNAKRVLKRTNFVPLELTTGLTGEYPNSNSFVYKGF